MEVLSPQLAQAVAAARVALAEAFVLKVGQTLQAVVVGKSADGLTLLKIGDQIVKAELPEGLPPGTTLQLQVKSAGPTPQLSILTQTTPQGRVVAPTMPIESRIAPGQPVRADQVMAERGVVPQIGESPLRVTTPASPIESLAAEISRPAPETRPVPAQSTPPASRAPITEPAAPVVLAPEPATPIPASATQIARGASVPAPPPSEVRVIVPGSTAPAVVVREAAPLTAILPPATPQPSATPEPVQPTASPAPAAQERVAVEAKTIASFPVPASAGSAANGAEPDFVHPLLVAQAAPRPPATLAELPRPVVVPSPAPQAPVAAQAPPPATRQAALSQMLPEAIARQDSVGPLLQSLATLVAKPATLPEPVLRTALAVLAQRIVAANGRVQPADLERAVLRSGLGLEATLARGEVPAPMDAKAGLLALRAGLAKWLGEAPPPVPQREAAPPPLKGLPLRAPDFNQPPLPDAPRDALRAVHGQADAAVSRLKLMQMASLPDPDPGRPPAPALRLELPLLIGHELVMAQLLVSRDGTRREAERKRGWTMKFALNFSATGEVGAEVGLLGKAVNVALWAAEPETAEAMQASLTELAGALEAVGLRPGYLRIRHASPEPEKPASGQLLDSTS